MTEFNRSKLWSHKGSHFFFVGTPLEVPERETAFELNDFLKQACGELNVFEVEEGYFQFCNLTEQQVEQLIPWNPALDVKIDDPDFQEMARDAS